ncbi:GNAT family N-acetyltransferase [Chitinophaga sp. GCM10012297]|uniref:GNAT family N-acetyltransferase n=1 Tax=Chitinophaga chungangae TaxID=2821488 RepID=A0ABS3YE38_9BACT|nr:GNAT family protein [Chitinophaga chungangae]MBO9152929.1 GNAT family N-acetyltransferase [Chitinophaga chungangae]
MLELPVNDTTLLRQLRTTDAPELFRLINHCRKTLRKFLPWVDYNTNEEHSLRFIELMMRKADEQEAVAFGIWFNNQLCGVIDLHDWDHTLQKAEIGYWITPEAQGRGIVTQSCKTLIGYAFAAMRLNKVEIRFVLQNEKSAQIPIKLGFAKEGILRQSAKLHGQYVDMVVMGMLRKDWKPQ